MVKASSRTVHHEFAKYLDLAHAGQKVVITKRGKPWATLTRVRNGREPLKKLDWNKFFERNRAISGGRKVNSVDAMLREREIDPRA